MDEKPELTTHLLRDADPSVQLRMISQVVGMPLDDFHRDILSAAADTIERLTKERDVACKDGIDHGNRLAKEHYHAMAKIRAERDALKAEVERLKDKINRGMPYAHIWSIN
ncbi:MAG: hypothetical protein ACR2RF_18780 [Geminicoccaceae bacterium]